MLPTALVNTMTDAGFFSLWLSRTFGGPELSFIECARVIEALSYADGSAGWCAMGATVLSRLSGYLADDVVREMFGDGHGRLAGSINPTGTAVAAPGGFRVSGRWSYGSFIHHSSWTVGNSILHDGETPRRDGNGAPDIRFMIMPTSAVEIVDNWHVSGLRGTGSCDFQVHDLFVPEEHTLSAFAAKPIQPGTLYATPMITIFAASIPCVSIGVARAAIDAFVASWRKPRLLWARQCGCATSRSLRLISGAPRPSCGPVVPFSSSRWRDSGITWRRAATLHQRAIVRLAAAKAAEASVQAVDMLFNAAGGTALFESNPIGRSFRDVHATTQHIGTNASNYELAGRVLLGLDPGTPRF
jgi:alkylation response protein AidB-like acyl-CoA dehydrogenase